MKKNMHDFEKELAPFKEALTHHPLYTKIQSIEDINVFMEQHVFAVWDFMSLVKKLQIELTTTQLPWIPSKYPQAGRLINEIVWGEESDINRKGEPMSHFEMYLEAMRSLNANTNQIDQLIFELNSGKTISEILETTSYPPHIKNFLKFTFEVVDSEQAHIIAAVFTFGREDLIPDMFIEIIKNLKNPEGVDLSDLIYYFERHIEVDSGEHGPMALEMIQQLCGTDTEKWESALRYSKQALELRIELWDGILATSKNRTPIFSIQ